MTSGRRLQPVMSSHLLMERSSPFRMWVGCMTGTRGQLGNGAIAADMPGVRSDRRQRVPESLEEHAFAGTGLLSEAPWFCERERLSFPFRRQWRFREGQGPVGVLNGAFSDVWDRSGMMCRRKHETLTTGAYRAILGHDSGLKRLDFLVRGVKLGCGAILDVAGSGMLRWSRGRGYRGGA